MFREEQQFRQPLLWILFGVFAVFMFVFLLVIMPALQPTPFNEIFVGVMVTLVVLVINGLLFYYMKLETVVTDSGVFVRWLPIQRRFRYFQWMQIERAVIRKMTWYVIGHQARRIGWGDVYRVQGTMGMQLFIKGRRPLSIGSQKINRLAEAVEKFTRLQRK
jgi:hypothetical protein